MSINQAPLAYFVEEVNLRLAKRLLITNGRLANRGLTSSVKEAPCVCHLPVQVSPSSANEYPSSQEQL